MDVPEELRQRFKLDEWRGERASDEDLHLFGFFFNGDELDGWNAERLRQVPADAWPPSTRTMWSQGERSERLLQVDVFECDSRADAHDLLVIVLGDFQSPLVERVSGPGDVAFAHPGDMAIAFARGNAVSLVRTAGERTVEVGEAAAKLDEHLAARPEPGGPVVPKIDYFRGRASAGGGELILDFEVADPLERPTWVKLWGWGGDFVRRDDVVTFTTREKAPGEIVLYAFNENHGCSVTRLSDSAGE